MQMVIGNGCRVASSLPGMNGVGVCQQRVCTRDVRGGSLLVQDAVWAQIGLAAVGLPIGAARRYLDEAALVRARNVLCLSGRWLSTLHEAHAE